MLIQDLTFLSQILGFRVKLQVGLGADKLASYMYVVIKYSSPEHSLALSPGFPLELGCLSTSGKPGDEAKHLTLVVCKDAH